jgi:murein DD-endopeptidase MepM/ murein hydrolase activator NlpD
LRPALWLACVLAMAAPVQGAQAADCRQVRELARKAPNFAHPVEGPIVSQFGSRLHPLLGVPRQHNGIDYGAPLGAPVHAAEAGIVESAGPGGYLGNVVILRHGDEEYETVYGRLKDVTVKPHDCVIKGELIGHVGRSGLTDSTHLHFEIRRALDPSPLLQSPGQ